MSWSWTPYLTGSREANERAEWEALEREAAQAEPQVQLLKVEDAHGPPEHVQLDDVNNIDGLSSQETLLSTWYPAPTPGTMRMTKTSALPTQDLGTLLCNSISGRSRMEGWINLTLKVTDWKKICKLNIQDRQQTIDGLRMQLTGKSESHLDNWSPKKDGGSSSKQSRLDSQGWQYNRRGSFGWHDGNNSCKTSCQRSNSKDYTSYHTHNLNSPEFPV